jgi:hypothetical protein
MPPEAQNTIFFLVKGEEYHFGTISPKRPKNKTVLGLKVISLLGIKSGITFS